MTCLPTRDSKPAVSANLLVTTDTVQYKRQGTNTCQAYHGHLASNYTTISDRFHNHVTPQLLKKGTPIPQHTPKPYHYVQKVNVYTKFLCDK